VSDRPGPPPGDGETEPGFEVTDNDDAETNSLEGRELDQLLVVSRDDPEIDLESTAELSGEEIEQLLRWADAQEDEDEIVDEATIEQEPDVTQAAIATLPMERHPDARAPAISLAMLAPPLPAPPPPTFQRPPATSTPVIEVRELGGARAELHSPRAFPRAPLVSSELPWRPRPRSALPTALVVAASAALAAGGIYTLIERGDETPPIAAPAVAPEPPPRAEPTVARPPAPDPRVDAAKQALRTLGEGLRECVKRSAMVLPGNSPAVPTRLDQTAGRGYEVAVNDFRTPVWSCAAFHVDSPMRFQIQWQLAKGGSEGLGIAWLDDDGDGKADRAFAFRASLKQRGQVEVGEVEPISPSRPSVAVTY